MKRSDLVPTVCALGAVVAGGALARIHHDSAIALIAPGAKVLDPAALAPPEPRPTPSPGADRLRVVLDPGHGGGNLGAPSVRAGLSEKHLTLALAFAVRDELLARGVDVSLTRERDEALSLRERSLRANLSGADVFVSLHLNATDNHAQRGFETWILTTDALETHAHALRSADGPPRADPALAPLLDDLERGAAQPDAARLAERIQHGLAAVRGKANDRGVRQGTQDVLLGATMPAVLVELLGFVDHPVEGEELLDPEVRRGLARALADAIAPPA